MQKICHLNDITANTGVVALYKKKQVAIFKISDEEIYAIDNMDPFSKANVLSRGIIGQDEDTIFIASPIYKQRFNLETGACLDDESVTLETFKASIVDQEVYLDS